ncbi:hypothetical protein DM860_014044 [Cuscuta australis]|uniref:Reverse transcriptase zinc-binding domain-containing protein n=1 Tax=Cuscuta australis TaxID=267555 RepID=A0A328DPH8_9ASTE|nr:hypothetical protein DM860_014044 [Cuscuta australis]
MAASGQEINQNKSRFYCGKGVKHDSIPKIEDRLGMKHGALPFKYLGAPICKGKLKRRDCGMVTEHFRKYIESWYSKTLNPMGRLILIKHVLSSIPLHLIAVHILPKSVINTLHSMMSNYLWGVDNNKPRYHWKNWKDLCTPTTEGGLGIRDLKDLQQAYSIKLWWNFRFSDSLWARFMRHKYSTENFQEKVIDSPVRKRICRIHGIAEELLGDIAPDLEDDPTYIPLKEAYECCRNSGVISLRDKLNWSNLQIPKVRFFLWKITNEILPFPENLIRFQVHMSSQCPFCKKNEANMNHCLLQCDEIKNIWSFYATILDGPRLREEISLNQYLMEWQLRSQANTIKGNLRNILPGVIAWCTWKQYAATAFGNEAANLFSITMDIKAMINSWCWKYRKKAWMIRDETLTAQGLQLCLNMARRNQNANEDGD